MRNACVFFVLVSILGSGCYVGRTPSAKRVNYALNGAAIVTGLAVMVAGSGSGDSCAGDVSCVGDALGDGGGAMIGLALLAAGALGIGISAIVPTKIPAPDGEDDGVIRVGRPTRELHSQL